MPTIYVVEGSTGEYSDHCEWPVAAYSRLEDAQARILRCEEGYRAACAECKRKGCEPAFELDDVPTPCYQHRATGTNPHDPDMQVDYTGTRYSYFEVDLDPPETL